MRRLIQGMGWSIFLMFFGLTAIVQAGGASDSYSIDFDTVGQDCATYLNNIVPAPSLNSDPFVATQTGTEIAAINDEFDFEFFVCTFDTVGDTLTYINPQDGITNTELQLGFSTLYTAPFAPTNSDNPDTPNAGSSRLLVEIFDDDGNKLDEFERLQTGTDFQIEFTDFDPDLLVREVRITLLDMAPLTNTVGFVNVIRGTLDLSPDNPPAITNLDANQSYSGPDMVLDADVVVEDSDYAGSGSLDLAFTSTFDANDALTLVSSADYTVTEYGGGFFDVFNETVGFFAAAGQYTAQGGMMINFNNSATITDATEILRLVRYNYNTTPLPTDARTIAVTFTDSRGTPVTESTTISFGAPNADPVINDLDGDTLSVTLPSGSVFLDVPPAVTITDDQANFDGGTLIFEYTAGFISADTMSFIPGDGVDSPPSSGLYEVDGTTIASGSTNITPTSFTWTLNLNANATPEAVARLIRRFGFFTASGQNGQRTITVTLQDGQGGTDTADVIINVGDPPANDLRLPDDFPCTGAGLQDAITALADNGTITLDCPGVIQLGSSILISGKVVNIAGANVVVGPIVNASIDNPQAVSSNVIDAGGSDRHFIVDNGTLNLIDLTLTNGSAPTGEGGGALLVQNSGTVTLTNVSIVNSEADGGAAIAVVGTTGGSEATLINTTIARNTSRAGGFGSVLGFSNGPQATLNLFNTTVTENNSGVFGGVAVQTNATLNINNSILANNENGDCANLGATVDFNTTNQINNIVLNDGIGGATSLCGNTTQYLDESPQFGAIQGLPPGVIQPHYRPASNSSAIDAGDDTLIPTGITEDQLGNARIRGASVDMGAYESEDVCTTTYFQDAGAVGTAHTVPAGDTANFIQAVLCANQLIGSQIIYLTESTYTFTQDYPADADTETALPVITDSLQINGLGNGAIVERDPGASEDFRLFLFDMVDIGPDPIGSVSNMTIRNGVASVGGAIAVQADGSVSVNNATLEDNSSVGAGGAMHSTGPRINSINSIFSNNTAGTSGGAMFSPTAMTLGESTFTGNIAQNGNGGAVVAQGEIRITNATMNNNSAPNGDGGAAHTNGNVLLAASTVRDNTAGGNGGAVYTTGPLTVLNSIIRDNSGVDGGGLYSNSDDESRVFNSLFHDNTAINDGGGLFINSSAAPVMRNNTFTQNIADSDNDSNGLGGGLFYNGGTVISNHIFWQNTLGNGNGTVDDFEGSLTFPTSIVSELGGSDPNFTDPANDDFTLQATSVAAIDQGDNALYVAPSELDFFVDIDGDGLLEAGPIDSDVAFNPRFFNSGTIDLGAYEFQGNLATGIVAFELPNVADTETIAGDITITRSGATNATFSANVAAYGLLTGDFFIGDACGLNSDTGLTVVSSVQGTFNFNRGLGGGRAAYFITAADRSFWMWYDPVANSLVGAYDLTPGNRLVVGQDQETAPYMRHYDVCNAPNIVNLDGDTADFTIGGSPVLLDMGSDAAATDEDSPDFDGGQLAVQIAAPVAGDVLGLDSSYTLTIGTIDGTNDGTNGSLEIDLNASATPATVSTLLQNLTFTTTDTNPGTRTLVIVLTDGDDPSPEIFPATVTVNVDEPPTPDVEITKSIGTVLADDGTVPPSFAVPVTLIITNTGNLPLTDVQITDDIATQIAPADVVQVSNLAISGDLAPATLDTNFDGETVTTLLQAGTGLDAGQTATITFTVNIDPNGAGDTFTNSASATASSSAGDVNDDSGPQQIDIPETLQLTLDKTAATPVNNGDGTVDIAYTISLTNDSNVTVNNAQITDDLATVFAAADSFSIVNGPTVTGATVNAAFDGDTDINLLAANTSVDASAVVTVDFTVRLTLSGGSSFSFDNAVAARADGVTGTEVTTSDNLVTDITFTPSIALTKDVTIADNANTLGLFDVTVTLALENDGDLNLNDVQVVDDLAAAFGPDVTITNLTPPEITGALDNTARNNAYDGVIDTNLLTSGVSLAVSEQATITFVVTINPDGTPGPFTNDAQASSVATTAVAADATDDAQIDIPENLLLTVDKAQVGDVVNNNDGTFDITYSLTLLNGSNVPLDTVQVVDDLAANFANTTSVVVNGSISADAPLTVNPAYDGSTDTNLLDAANSSIGVGQSLTITVPVRITLTFGDSLTHTNSVTASGVSPLDSDVTDDGDVQTTIDVNPVIGIAKAATVTADGDSAFDIAFTFTVQNLGDIPLSGLQITDNLGVFYNGSDLQAADISSTGGDLTYNANFDGQADINLLTGADTIAVGETRTLTILLDAVQPTTTGLFTNRADAFGEGIVSIVTDISDDGTTPDTDNDGNANEAGENDPTIVTLTTSTLSAQKAVDLLPQDDPNNNGIAEPGEVLTYTITIVNTSSVAAVNTRFMDTLDPNTTLLQVEGVTNLATGDAIEAELGDLAIGAQVVFTYTAEVKPQADWVPQEATEIRNQGTVMADNLPQAVLTDDPATPQVGDATIIELADPQATLEITKSDAVRSDADGSRTISAGDTLQYIVTVRNTGGITAENVVLTDEITDANLVYVPGTGNAELSRVDLPQPQGDINGNILTVTLAQLPAGETLTFTYDVRVANPLVDAAATQISNQADVVADNAMAMVSDDPDTTQPDDPTLSPLGATVNLVATKRVDLLRDADGSGSASPGDRLQYRIVVENPGPTTAENVALTDTLDANLTLIAGSLTTTQGTINSGSSSADTVIDVTIGDVQPGWAVIISYVATINQPLTQPATQISNQGTLTLDNGNDVLTDDPALPALDDPTVIDLQADVNLSLTKTGVRIGDDITYTLTLTNNGTATATGLRLEDLATDPNLNLVPGSVVLPAGASIVTDTADMLVLNLADLGPSANVVVTFDAQVANPRIGNPTEVSNQARLTGDNINTLLSDDPSTAQANDPTRLVLDQSAILDVTKAATFTEPVLAGATVTYQIIVTNRGNATANNVIVTDALDDAAIDAIQGTPTAISSGAGTPTVENPPDGSLRVTIDQLEPSQTLTIGVAVTLVNSLPDGQMVVTNQATVTGDNVAMVVSDDPATPAVDDATLVPLGSFGEMDATLSDSVVPQVDFAPQSTPDDPVQARPGDFITYTARLTNTSGNDALTVVYTDAISDPNLTLISGSVQTSAGTIATGNTDGDTTVRVEVGTLAADAIVTITYQVQVAEAVPQGVTSVATQGSITSDNVSDTLTRDPSQSGQAETRTGLIVDRFSNLTVQLSAPEQATVGSRILYRVDVRNSEEAANARNVRTAVPLPANTTFAESIEGECELRGDQIICTIGDINPGAVASASFFVTVDAATPLDTVITAQAQAAATATPVPQPSNAVETRIVDTLTTTDIAIQLDDNRTALISGNTPDSSTTTTYGLRIFNTGLDVNDATITMTLPDNTFDPATIQWACRAVAPQTDCPTIVDTTSLTQTLTNVSLVNGGELQIFARGRLLDINRITPVPPPPVEVVASVQSALDPDGVTGNNSARDVDGVVYDPPTGVKSGTFDGGDIITWTQTWINNNAFTATDVEINDPLGSGQTFIPGSLVCELNGVTAGTCAYDEVSNSVTFVGAIGPDGPGFTTPDDSLRITFQIRVAGGGDYGNTATLTTDTGTPATVAATNTVNVPLPPAPPGGGAGTPNLTLTKSVNPVFAQPGDDVTFTLTVTNTGSGASGGFTVTDVVPNEFEIVGTTVNGIGNATVSGQTVTYTGSGLAANSSTSVTVQTTIRSAVAVPFSLTNTATLNDQTANATVISVRELPATGETPWWRTPLLLGLTTLIAFGLAWGGWHLRRRTR